MKPCAICLLYFFLLAKPASGIQLNPEYPGVLVVESARDTSLFNLETIGSKSSLTWQSGSLVFSQEADTGTFGVNSLTIAYDVSLAGLNDGVELVFQNGRYNINSPLIMTSPDFILTASEGVLEISEGRIDLKMPIKKNSNNSDYILLAGMIIFIAVLLNRSRKKKQSSC
jgi:hypothetical protein